MRPLLRRVATLEADAHPFLTIGEMIDFINGEPLPVGKVSDPAIIRALEELPV